MKSEAGIRAYLDTIWPKREIDELAIRQYLGQRNISCNFADSYNAGVQIVTFDDVKSWIQADLPCDRDVLCLPDGSIGIVRKADINSLSFYALLSSGGEVAFDVSITGSVSFTPAKKEQMTLLQRSLSSRKLQWQKRKRTVIPKCVPENNQAVRLTQLGEIVGFGIFKEIDSDGNIVMYCYQEKGHPIRYSLNEPVGPLANYQLEFVSKSERGKIDLSLAVSGLIWNGRTRSIEPLNKRVNRDSNYYYLNSFFEAAPAPEKGRKRDTARLRGWNYFRSYKTALEFSCQITEKLSEIERPQVKRGDSYYYLDQYFAVKRVTFNLKPRDRSRMKAGNCFISKEEVEKFRQWLVETRKHFFILTIQDEIPKKRGRKPKNLI